MGLKSRIVGAWRRATGQRTFTVRPAMPASTGKHAGEIGRSGTRQYGGFVFEDENPDFNGRRAIEIYEQMRKTDATVAAVLEALKLPIMSAEARIDTADKTDDLQNEIAEFVRSNLFDTLEGGWREFLRQSLSHLDFGFAYFEKVYEIKDGQVRLKKLAQRLQTAHWKWMMDDQPTVPGVTQLISCVDNRQDPDAPSQPQIPMEKLVCFTNRKEGDNYEGISVLRSAYKHFHFKDTLYRIDGTKHERGAGILVIELPQTATDTDREDAAEMGENFKVNDKSYIVKPHGWGVTLLSDGIKDQTSSLMTSVEHHDRMIMLNVLAQFLGLGSSDKGSFSLSKDQTSFFAMALTGIVNAICNVINTQLIKQLVDLNYGEQEAYPTLCFSKIGDTNLDVMSNVILRLKQAGVVKVDAQFLTWVADTFGLPKLTPEDFEEEDGDGPIDPNADPEGGEGGPVDPATGARTAPGARRTAPPPVRGQDPAKAPQEGEEGELAEMRFWRPLTEAEKRVKFFDIARQFDESEDDVADALKKLTEEQKRKLLKKASSIIDADDIGAVSDLALPDEAAVAGVLTDKAKDALEKGKAAAAGEMGVSIPTTTSYAKKVLAGKIALYAKRRGDSITDAVRQRLLNLMNNDVGKAKALFELEKIIDQNANAANNALAGKVGVEFFNEGRYLTFDDMKDQLHGLQRSEILDDRTCATCMSLDGRVISASDPFGQIDQIHDWCRGMWVGIAKSDKDLPPAKALPKSILNRFDLSDGVPATNAYNPMEKPIVTKGSRVERKIRDGELDV